MKKIFYKVFVCSFLDIAAFLFCYNSQAQVVINEVYYNPASGLAGDANGDGIRSASQDEFVEMVNTSANTINISAWTLADADGICFTFPANTNLLPHQAVLVFGGGQPSGEFGNAQVFIKSLGLNNSDNSVILRNSTAQKIDSMAYKTNDGVGCSLTKSPDLTGNFEAFSKIGNGNILFSPGQTTDLQPFVSNYTDIENEWSTTSFKFYPNPVSGSLFYDYEEDHLLKFSLVDIYGKVENLHYDATKILLPSSLSSGIYWLKVDTSKGVIIRKIFLL